MSIVQSSHDFVISWLEFCFAPHCACVCGVTGHLLCSTVAKDVCINDAAGTFAESVRKLKRDDSFETVNTRKVILWRIGNI